MEDKKKRRWMLAGAFAAGVVAAIVLMTVFNVGIGDKAYVSFTEYENARKVADKYAELESLYNFLEENYYTELDEEDLMTGIYKGLFSGANDIYTRYLTAEEYKDASEDATGNFEGIGVVMSASQEGLVEIVSVMEDSPAQKAGLRDGDLILTADGEPLVGENNLAKASSLIKGESGTQVTLMIQRGTERKEYTVTREPISEVSVGSKVLDDNIGYIRIASFISDTASQFEEQLTELEQKNVRGLIIDLRSNGGGLISQSTRIADLLMDEGTIVCVVDGKGERQALKSKKGRTKLPYVILVNGGSASASEILTAGVQDNREGYIIGTKTYGKGIIQQMMRLKNGDGIEITISQYLSPGGKVIHKKGITPDQVVEVQEEDIQDGALVRDRQLEAAEEYLKTH